MAKKRGNGEGSISKRKDGTWCAVITVGRKPDGKLKQKFFYGKTRQEVAEKLNKALNELRQGTFVEATAVTVESWLKTWLEEYKRPKVRLTTFESYRIMAESHIIPAVGHIKLKDLRPEHLQHLYNEKLKTGLSPRTVRYIHLVIHSALKQAVKNQLVARNVSEATELPADNKKEARALTMEEMDRFLNALESDRLKAAFITLLGTGLRRGELLALKWDNVNLKEGTIAVKENLAWIAKKGFVFQPPKTEKSKRVVPLPDDVLAELKKHKARQAEEKLKLGESYQDNGLVFCTEIGTPIIPRNFERKFKLLLKKADLTGIKLHSLRHTYATRLLELGENLKVVQELLGHSRISVTADIYSHVSPELKRGAAAKLNGLFTK
jgi:integrase